jgi:hypothetical protein
VRVVAVVLAVVGALAVRDVLAAVVVPQDVVDVAVAVVAGDAKIDEVLHSDRFLKRKFHVQSHRSLHEKEPGCYAAPGSINVDSSISFLSFDYHFFCKKTKSCLRSKPTFLYNFMAFSLVELTQSVMIAISSQEKSH